MKNLVIVVAVFLFSIPMFCQNADSIVVKQNKLLSNISDRFAVARPFNLSYTLLTPTNYKFNGIGVPEKGEISNLSQLNFSSNLIFIKKRKWILDGTFLYRFNKFDY